MNLWRLVWLPPVALLWLAAPLPALRLALLFVTGFVVANGLYSWYLRRRLEIRAEQGRLRAFPGQSTVIRLAVLNRGWLPTGPLVVHDAAGLLEALRRPEFLCRLAPRGSGALSWTAVGQERGAYPLGPVEVRGSDPAGLFPFKIQFDLPRQLLVYPAAPVLEGLVHKGPGPGHLVRRHGNPDVSRFSHLRPFQAGDRWHDVAAKASARFGQLLSVVREASLEGSAEVFLRLSLEAYPLKNRHLHLERAVSTAAAVVLEFFARGERLGLRLEGAPALFPGQGAEAAVVLLEALAGVQGLPRSADALDSWTTTAPGTRHILYIGPPPPPELEQLLLFHRRRGCQLTLLLVGTSAAAFASRAGLRAVRTGDHGDIVLESV